MLLSNKHVSSETYQDSNEQVLRDKKTDTAWKPDSSKQKSI